MSYDERDKGFPLLQNIILQAVLEENNYDSDLGKDFFQIGNTVKGVPFGYLIEYTPTPGYFFEMEGNPENIQNFFIISPYLDSKTKSFHKAIPSGKFLVILFMFNGIYGSFPFDFIKMASKTVNVLNPEFDNNDIDLTLYIDFNNQLKSANYQEKKLKCLENSKKEFYHDKTDGKIEYKTFDELQKEYGDYLKLLDDIQIEEPKKALKWGIIKNEYFIFIGQFNSSDYKEGKGIYINPHNIFVGEFSGNCQNGKGYTYNKNYQKLFYYMYEHSQPIGEPVLVEKDLEEIEKGKIRKEKELKEEQERLKKIKEEKQALLKKKEKELVMFLLNAQKEKKKNEEMELAKKKEEEEKRKQDEEEKKIEAQKKAEEAKKEVEEIKNQLKEAKDKEQKILDDIKKNQLELKKTNDERKKIEQKKTEKELKKLEKEKEKEFGVNIYYPDYLIEKNKYQTHQTQEESKVCLTCACNIF